MNAPGQTLGGNWEGCGLIIFGVILHRSREYAR